MPIHPEGHGTEAYGTEAYGTEKVMEELAGVEHERWAHWQRYLHSRCERRSDGSLTIPAELVRRWEAQMATPYAELSEAEKESDREQVRRYLPLLVAMFGPAV
ncbi:hypothetical protein [Streptomyces liangshanensis]|uniref:Uncharacterized protein n=1 Tax=Streptomyces liangshanensis TaxID=2717324 RepID=A0A6G9H6Q0_9ACTN|nr:hypothetical protein [Streptomyces liangshanensis]QIQ06170.1 hypothetical protein HA039_31100 [Streptomyces liangshanensis]